LRYCVITGSYVTECRARVAIDADYSSKSAPNVTEMCSPTKLGVNDFSRFRPSSP